MDERHERAMEGIGVTAAAAVARILTFMQFSAAARIMGKREIGARSLRPRCYHHDYELVSSHGNPEISMVEALTDFHS